MKTLFQWNPKQVGEWIKCRRSKKQNERRIIELENCKISAPSSPPIPSFFGKQEPRATEWLSHSRISTPTPKRVDFSAALLGLAVVVTVAGVTGKALCGCLQWVPPLLWRRRQSRGLGALGQGGGRLAAPTDQRRKIKYLYAWPAGQGDAAQNG